MTRFSPRLTVLRGLIALTLLAPLAACGFRPVYADAQTGGPIAAELAAIDIDPQTDRIGLMVQEALADKLKPFASATPAKYRLTLKLTETPTGVAVGKDSGFTRFNYMLTGEYALYDLKTGAGLTSGALRSISAYNVVGSQFATLSAERDARERAARDLTDDLWSRLGVYFERKAGG